VLAFSEFDTNAKSMAAPATPEAMYLIISFINVFVFILPCKIDSKISPKIPNEYLLKLKAVNEKWKHLFAEHTSLTMKALF
jgi:hypothetical protein